MAGAPPVASKSATRSDAKPGTMESEALLAGNVQRLQFLRKKTGIDLGVSVGFGVESTEDALFLLLNPVEVDWRAVV